MDIKPVQVAMWSWGSEVTHVYSNMQDSWREIKREEFRMRHITVVNDTTYDEMYSVLRRNRTTIYQARIHK